MESFVGGVVYTREKVKIMTSSFTKNVKPNKFLSSAMEHPKYTKNFGP